MVPLVLGAFARGMSSSEELMVVKRRNRGDQDA